MRYFYTKRADGSIESFIKFNDEETVPSFILEGFIETDKEIVQVTDGRLMFAVDVDPDAEELAKLNRAKQSKISDLKQKRDMLEVTPIAYKDTTFDYDDKARERLQIAKNSIEAAIEINKHPEMNLNNGGDPLPETIEWTTAENTRVEMNIEDFNMLNVLAAARSNSLHIKYNELKNAVNNCNTLKEVEDIEWI